MYVKKRKEKKNINIFPKLFFYQEAVFLENDGKDHNRCRINGFSKMQAKECIYLWTVKSKGWLEHGVHFEGVLQNEIRKRKQVWFILHSRS